MTHFLKTKHEYFVLALNGYKNVEIRKNDRNFQAGDKIILADFLDIEGMNFLSGLVLHRTIKKVITNCPGLLDGYVLLIFEKE